MAIKDKEQTNQKKKNQRRKCKIIKTMEEEIISHSLVLKMSPRNEKNYAPEAEINKFEKE